MVRFLLPQQQKSIHASLKIDADLKSLATISPMVISEFNSVDILFSFKF